MEPLRLDHQPVADRRQPVPADVRGFVNYLRSVAMECRAKPKADLFQACALLHVKQSRSTKAHAEALMRCLGEALGQPAKLLAPGAMEMTFDEAWLAQLGQAAAREDEATLRFLLASRVAHEHRRLVRFVMSQVSRSLFRP